ncbi:ketol-acid reductoisomerase [Pavlovales sp. CCMP2436]|nr:ketol-acid reductoisomerase [Pavlovales sp. CCMP2436]
MLTALSRTARRVPTAAMGARRLAAMPLHPQKKFTSKFFAVEEATFADQTEQIVRGGRSLFPKLPAALAGVKQIGVIGWGSQGPAQAQNFRESLEGSGITVKVGLREGSSSMKLAREAGFTEANGTLGEMYKVISESDFTLLLISDAACVEEYKNVFKVLKPNSTLGLSHGFLLGHLEAVHETFPANVDVVLCAPKGMGPSVRRLYEQGREVNGSGINASFAVHQDVTGHATERALAWAVGVGSPYIFQTTLNAEWRSDIFGERCILLGGVHGMIESLFRYYESIGMSAKDAFKHSGEVITGPITQTISHDGIRAVYEKLSPADQKVFKQAYCASYLPSRSIIEECYDSVSSGNEIRDVVMASRRFDKYPMGCIDNTRTWQVGAEVRKEGGTPDQRRAVPVHPVTAGVYCSMMMAQIDCLYDRGHVYSEIVNESVIESVDSLNPYMHARGVSYMVDNCSVTARLGSRKWAPRFDYILTEQAFPAISAAAPADEKLFASFLSHPVHDMLKTCSTLRPTVDISVV